MMMMMMMMMMKLRGIRKEKFMTYIKYCNGLCMEGLMRTMEKLSMSSFVINVTVRR
jgi:hypothetical protein